MTKNTLDKRKCAFCGKIAKKGIKSSSVYKTMPNTLIKDHPDAFQSIYKGQRKTNNEICHSKCGKASKIGIIEQKQYRGSQK
jgi:hypothetical protein